MRSFFKKWLFLLLGFIATAGLFAQPEAHAQVPRFQNNFAQYLMQGENSLFNLGIDRTKSLEENIRNLFYPASGGKSAGLIRDMIRFVGLSILILYFVLAGYKFISNADNDKELANARTNFVYILYGSFLFFGATWILGTALQINNPWGGSEALVFSIRNRLLFQFLAFLKAAAFFGAIVYLIYHGYQFMNAMEKEAKIKQAKEGVINVLAALIFIKVIDYIYYIASATDFKDKATAFIVQVSKFMGYLIGVVMLGSIFYAGLMMVTSNGKDEDRNKAKSIILTIFLVAVIIFLFLLVVYQVFNEFVPA